MFTKAFKKSLKLISNIVWRFILILEKSNKKPIGLTFGITTFLDRFDNCFKPLLERLCYLFPEDEIIVVANGHVKKNEQENYILEIKKFCLNYKNVKLITYVNPIGLSNIWNKIISYSKNQNVFILNDDLDINFCFRKEIEKNNLSSNNTITVINKSWSHFVINKHLIETIGPFDEELKEIGGEDDDYAARCALSKVELLQLTSNSIWPRLNNKRKKITLNSYGKNMNEEAHGYSTYNSNYLNKKWETSNKHFEGATFVPYRIPKYWKLKV